jgi:hypothetical protein
MISNEIGKMKLEGIVLEAIFIAPKLYYVKYDTNEEIIKFKGLENNKATYNDIYQHYISNDFNYEKIYTIENLFNRNYKTYNLFTNVSKYKVSGIFRKREKIYDSNGLWIDTKPLFYHNDKYDENAPRIRKF